MNEQLDIFTALASPESGVTGHVTGDTSDASKQLPVEACPSESDVASNSLHLVEDTSGESRQTKRFTGQVSEEINPDGSRAISGELHVEGKSPDNNRQSRCRKKKEVSGQKRVEVWVPDGMQEKIRAFAAQLRQERGIEN